MWLWISLALLLGAVVSFVRERRCLVSGTTGFLAKTAFKLAGWGERAGDYAANYSVGVAVLGAVYGCWALDGWIAVWGAQPEG